MQAPTDTEVTDNYDRLERVLPIDPEKWVRDGTIESVAEPDARTAEEYRRMTAYNGFEVLKEGLSGHGPYNAVIGVVALPDHRPTPGFALAKLAKPKPTA